MKLRRMNEKGIERFSDFIDKLRSDPTLETPKWLLEDDEFSDVIADVELENLDFENRLNAAKYLDKTLAKARIKNADKDIGLWSFLTLFYFDQLCPYGKNRKVAVDASYIPNTESQRRIYRHLLLGPWMMLRLHADNPDKLRGLLCSKINVATSETFRLFIEQPSLITSGAAVEVASLLYFNNSTGKLKKGAGSKTQGGCRRLIDFFNQLDCTYDLATLDPKELMDLLPNEFLPFIPKQKELF